MCYSLIHVVKTFREQSGGTRCRKIGWHLATRISEAGTVCAQSGDRDRKARGEGCRAREGAGIAVTTNNREAVKGADIVLLTVKPQTVAEVLQEIAPKIGADALVVSVAASVPAGFVEQQLAGAASGKRNDMPVVRAMPNTPAAVHCGMTAICSGTHASSRHLDVARAMFDTVGRTIVLDQKHMDAVTGLSASGPAFAYIILESLAEAGVKVGLPRDVATLLAAQTMKGAASVVLETGDHPALLKDAVTTPAGCTIDGILELEEGKLRVTLIKAVVKATSRAGELLFEK